MVATAFLTLNAGALLTACGGDPTREAHAGPAKSQAPVVTVAYPEVAQVAETDEYSGRAESPDYVEIRARATGYLQKTQFHEGELVKKGDLLFVVDPRPYQAALARAHAEHQRALAGVDLSKRDSERVTQLWNSKSISEREYDAQNSQLTQLLASADVAAAAESSAALDLEYTRVRAPIDGRVGRMMVTPGNLVGASLPSPLTTLVSVDPLYVYVDIDEARALKLRGDASGSGKALGKGSQPLAVGFADEDGLPHPARIDFLDNRIDPATGTLKIRAVVPNHDGHLTPGSYARVRLPAAAEAATVLVTDRAINTDQDRKFVYVVDDKGAVAYRAVKLGPLHDKLRVVREGLSERDRVIVKGLQRVRPGVVVAAETVAMRALEAPQKEVLTATQSDAGAP